MSLNLKSSTLCIHISHPCAGFDNMECNCSLRAKSMISNLFPLLLLSISVSSSTYVNVNTWDTSQRPAEKPSELHSWQKNVAKKDVVRITFFLEQAKVDLTDKRNETWKLHLKASSMKTSSIQVNTRLTWVWLWRWGGRLWLSTTCCIWSPFKVN